jgi:hypothetical protein
VAALGITAFLGATGGLGRIAGAFGATLGGALEGLTATPSPRPTIPVVADAPVITAPDEPYTNQPAVDLIMALPPEVVGDADTSVRIYLSLSEEPAVRLRDVPVGALPTLVVPGLELTPGRNDFSATVVSPAGESNRSPVVTWVLDTDPPGINVTSPKEGQTINRAAVAITGKTQARSTIVGRNEANAASVSAEAASDGTFELVVPIEIGPNGISLISTDPAGNVGEAVVAVQRGTGKLTAALRVGPVRLSRARLPDPLELSVVVNDPDGRPLEGAQVTFTLSIPGIQVVTSEAETAGNGRAVFRTTVPKGAVVGEGLATVLVRTGEFGTTTDQTVVAIVR